MGAAAHLKRTGTMRWLFWVGFPSFMELIAQNLCKGYDILNFFEIHPFLCFRVVTCGSIITTLAYILIAKWDSRLAIKHYSDN